MSELDCPVQPKLKLALPMYVLMALTRQTILALIGSVGSASGQEASILSVRRGRLVAGASRRARLGDATRIGDVTFVRADP
mmetsp:Transcript_114026/g.179508  ORF Transcript_114026/g.179508 Transcript_114026/m.179508 type:complete len:81 (-) Transcript_114026:1390-1632(-)